MKAKRSEAFSLECLGREVPHGMKDRLAKPEPINEAASENTSRILPLAPVGVKGDSKVGMPKILSCIIYLVRTKQIKKGL